MVKQDLSGECQAIKESIRIIRAKFQPYLDKNKYIDDVDQLVEVVPKMMENVEAMADELDNAFGILSGTPRK